MKKVLNIILHRLFIVIVLLLVQVLILFLLLTKFKDSFQIFYFLMEALGGLVLLKIINDKSNPNFKIPWIILVLTIPVFGTFAYLLFGNKKGYKNKVRNDSVKLLKENNLFQEDVVLDNLKLEDKDFKTQANYLKHCGFPIYQDTLVEYFKIGEEYYEKLLEEIKKAKYFIFLEYFIIHEGKMWNSILDILIKKVSEGVDVRVIYDDIGCITTLPHKYYNKLNKLGIKCVSFNKFVPILTSKLNNRDHKKIAVIDGNIGFTGGINLADEYINEINRFGHWKDNGVMLKGNAVFTLTTIFLTTWDNVTNTKDDFTKYSPNYYNALNTINNSYITVYDDTPLDNEPVGKNVYLNLINNAKKYIYITTPYLIIDDELENALILASKRLVDIKIITPYIADKKIVNELTKAHYPNLIKNNIKIYEYKLGFIHAKTFLVDDMYATVGTVNLDYRSLYFHFECGVLIYKDKVLFDIKNDLIDTIKNSIEIKTKDTKIDFIRTLKRLLLKLFAPLM